MAWQIEFEADAVRDLAALDKGVQRLIRRYLRERIAVADNPRSYGKPLRGDLSGIWRYRVTDYRIFCKFEDEKLIVLVVQIGHRKEIYDR